MTNTLPEVGMSALLDGYLLVRDKDDWANPRPGTASIVVFRSHGIGRSDAQFAAQERSGNGGKPQAIFEIADGTESLAAEYLDGQPQYPPTYRS
jgi:hypothetical protein